MSAFDILHADDELRTDIDQFKKPSETIWPATVAIIVELCPENKSAMANTAPAAKVIPSASKSHSSDAPLTFTNMLLQKVVGVEQTRRILRVGMVLSLSIVKHCARHNQNPDRQSIGMSDWTQA